MGITIGKISENQKKTFGGLKLLHLHIEEDETKIVCFITKINLIKKNMRNLRFKIFAVIMELHCNSKNLISHIFLDQIDFCYKTDYLSLALLYMWVKYELI